MGGKFAVSLKIFLIVTVFFNAAAMGVILHPSTEPGEDWVDKPASDVMGRWAGNASCVAVGWNYVITTRHQGGGVGSTVEIGGVSYTVEHVANHPIEDVRVARLKNAVLSNYVGIYEGSDERGKNIVIGGYGDGVLEILKRSGVTYGYTWDNFSNTVGRWGTNKIEDLASSGTDDNTLVSFFDDPGATPYECALADHDSGGGWFIYSGGLWKVAGLSAGVERHYDGNVLLEESWFRDPVWPGYRSHPDFINAFRISVVAEWIGDQIINDCEMPLAGDVNTDCKVDMLDLEAIAEWWVHDDCSGLNNYCQNADINRDGIVDLKDFSITVDNWGN